MHGYLEMQSMSFDDEYNCKVFDQSSVNTEKMFYIQAGVNQSTDYFVFDVTNGITWLRQLMIKIVIIPEKLYMHSNIISVVEGKTVQLNPTDIQPYSEYYRGKILEYIVTITPSSGHVLAGNSKVKRFTQKQLEQGSIQYVHNGSENATDSITLVAMARNKESVPFELEFAVVQVNDEEPMMVTNTGLQVWNGGRYVIKNTDLRKLKIYCIPNSKLKCFIFVMMLFSGSRLRHSTGESYICGESHIRRLLGKEVSTSPKNRTFHPGSNKPRRNIFHARLQLQEKRTILCGNRWAI